MNRFVQIITKEERIVMRFGENQTITIRRIPEAKSLEIRTRFLGEGGRKTPGEAEEASYQITNEVLKYVVVDWSGIVDADGNEVSCTLANIELLPTMIKEEILMRSKSADAKSDPAEEEAETENLSDSPVSKQPAPA